MTARSRIHLVAANKRVRIPGNHNCSIRHRLRRNAVCFDGHAGTLAGPWMDKPANDLACPWDGYCGKRASAPA